MRVSFFCAKHFSHHEKIERANHNYEAAIKQVEHLQERTVKPIKNDDENKKSDIDVEQIENEIQAKERELTQLTTELARLEKKHTVEMGQLQRQLNG